MYVARMSTIVGAVMVVILLQSGCKEECDCPPQELYVGYICMEEGMSLDGELLVVADPLHHAESVCEDSTLAVIGKGYRACCDEICCEWHPDDPDYPAHVNGPCETDEDCGFGLMCREEPAPEDQEPIKLCRYGSTGEPCDYSHFCSDGHYCHPQMHVCEAPSYVEGVVCDPSAPSCGLPLKCVCVSSGKGCYCYDGTDNDPCQLGTCEAGLYCAYMDDDAVENTCADGSKGAACSWNVQCQGKLVCESTGVGKRCVKHLTVDEPCPEATDPFARCADNLVCNQAFEPARCVLPGEDGAACSVDDDCAWAHSCFTLSGECFDGSEGDPCQIDAECPNSGACISWVGFCADGSLQDPCEEGTCTYGLYCHLDVDGGGGTTCHDGIKGDPCKKTDDCNNGLECMEIDESFRCLEMLPSGTECLSDPTAGWATCNDGLFCNAALEPPICAKPGGNAEPCVVEEACAEGFLCLPDLNLCSDGGPGAPCLVDEFCADQLLCVEAVSSCQTGEPGAACDDAEDCAQDLLCNSLTATCEDGLEGDQCSDANDCANGLLCNSLTGTCKPGLEGEPCGDIVDCIFGLVCIESDGACHDGSQGDPCDTPAQCFPGLTCVDGFCDVSQQ